MTLLLGKGKRVVLSCDLIVGEGEEGGAECNYVFSRGHYPIVTNSLQVPETLRTCSSTESQLQLKTSVRQLCEVAEAVVVCLSK